MAIYICQHQPTIRDYFCTDRLLKKLCKSAASTCQLCPPSNNAASNASARPVVWPAALQLVQSRTHSRKLHRTCALVAPACLYSKEPIVRLAGGCALSQDMVAAGIFWGITAAMGMLCCLYDDVCARAPSQNHMMMCVRVHHRRTAPASSHLTYGCSPALAHAYCQCSDSTLPLP
jgi:hypothetical protein